MLPRRIQFIYMKFRDAAFNDIYTKFVVFMTAMCLRLPALTITDGDVKMSDRSYTQKEEGKACQFDIIILWVDWAGKCKRDFRDSLLTVI